MSQAGNEWFLFGAPGSTACKSFAAAEHQKVVKGVHCLISGPLLRPRRQDPPRRRPRSSRPGSRATRPPARGARCQAGNRRRAGGAQQLRRLAEVRLAQRRLLRAQQPRRAARRQDQQPGGQHRLERAAGASTSGSRATAGTLFQNVTGTIALRGSLDSPPGQQLNQHFAIALDNQLVSVPYIDFHLFPEGIPSTNGSEISGGFTTETAQRAGDAAAPGRAAGQADQDL